MTPMTKTVGIIHQSIWSVPTNEKTPCGILNYPSVREVLGYATV